MIKIKSFPHDLHILIILDIDDAICPVSDSQDEIFLLTPPKPALSLLQFLQTRSSVR